MVKERWCQSVASMADARSARDRQERMGSYAERYDVDDTDYDGTNQKRWYYRLYCDQGGGWFWEPRLPTPGELAAPHALAGASWEPTTLTAAEWPSAWIRGPYRQRGNAITAAEEWFDSTPESRR